MLALLLESALRSLALGALVWIGLRVFRERSTHIQSLAWAAVLLTSLLMPVLMTWHTVTVSMPVGSVEPVAPLIRTIPLSPAPVVQTATPAGTQFWVRPAEIVYFGVGSLLLLRILIGLLMTARLRHRARPLLEAAMIRLAMSEHFINVDQLLSQSPHVHWQADAPCPIPRQQPQCHPP